MRRQSGNFSWVSMMDLLFGLFGGLVILTIMITLKLGASSSIVQRPFVLINVEIGTPSEAPSELAEALRRAHIVLRVTVPNSPSCPTADSNDANQSRECSCSFGAGFHADEHENLCRQLIGQEYPLGEVRFLTATLAGNDPEEDLALGASLFIGGGAREGSPGVLIEPFLSDVSFLRDAELDQNATVIVRLSAKLGDLVWQPPDFCLAVHEILQRADNDRQQRADASLLVDHAEVDHNENPDHRPVIGHDCSDPETRLFVAPPNLDSPSESNHTIAIEGGRIVFR